MPHPALLAHDVVRTLGTRRVLDGVGLTGENGVGKSTLLAVLAGRLEAGGEVRRRRNLTVGLLSQDTAFDRPDRESALGTGPGAIVLASHDRWLRRRWPGRELRLHAAEGAAAR